MSSGKWPRVLTARAAWHSRLQYGSSVNNAPDVPGEGEEVYIALGVRADGRKEILGLWIEQTEGAKFWLRVMNELKNRGISDILIAVVDGLKGFPEAINAVFPLTVIRLVSCI